MSLRFLQSRSHNLTISIKVNRILFLGRGVQRSFLSGWSASPRGFNHKNEPRNANILKMNGHVFWNTIVESRTLPYRSNPGCFGPLTQILDLRLISVTKSDKLHCPFRQRLIHQAFWLMRQMNQLSLKLDNLTFEARGLDSPRSFGPGGETNHWPCLANKFPTHYWITQFRCQFLRTFLNYKQPHLAVKINNLYWCWCFELDAEAFLQISHIQSYYRNKVSCPPEIWN